ncbi:MAG: HAMP domain-containing protein [Clostridia bacterium]|nr:HAMP domain-containing protein [Clostridia bacterium]
MYKSLYFKIVLMLVIFTVAIMIVVGAVLLNSAYSFYNNEFTDQMDDALGKDSDLRAQLTDVLDSDDYGNGMYEILRAYSSSLGINSYRDFYVLSMSGDVICTSVGEMRTELKKTPNVISALNGADGTEKKFGTDYIDYAIYLSNGENECVVYIYDAQEEVRSFIEMLFSIIMQSMLIGLLISTLLSFFLAKAITSPLQNITAGAQRIAAGEFSYEITSRSKDEIGILTNTFSNMKDTLKNTMDEISGERQKFETLFVYLNDAVIAFDEFGRTMHINKTAKQLFFPVNLSATSVISESGTNEFIEKNFTFVKMIRMLQIDYTDAAAQFKSRKNFTMHDVKYQNFVLDISFLDFKYIENNCEHSGIMCVIHDVTGRYELDRSRREFVADVSHELRTPITGIKGAAETVLEYPDMPLDMRENFLRMAIDECDRMTRLVSDLLVLSRLDNKRTNWQIESFDLSKLINHILEVMKTDVEAHRHTLEYEYDESIGQIRGDKEKIGQVIINILSNAIKYTPDGGKIILKAENRVQYVVVSVQDNGIGVPEEDIPRLFERFYRVEKSRTSQAGGTGLGLAIAKEIINAHGGDITVESQVGVGTTMTVAIPYEASIEATTY